MIAKNIAKHLKSKTYKDSIALSRISGSVPKIFKALIISPFFQNKVFEKIHWNFYQMTFNLWTWKESER